MRVCGRLARICSRVPVAMRARAGFSPPLARGSARCSRRHCLIWCPYPRHSRAKWAPPAAYPAAQGQAFGLASCPAAHRRAAHAGGTVAAVRAGQMHNARRKAGRSVRAGAAPASRCAGLGGAGTPTGAALRALVRSGACTRHGHSRAKAVPPPPPPCGTVSAAAARPEARQRTAVAALAGGPVAAARAGQMNNARHKAGRSVQARAALPRQPARSRSGSTSPPIRRRSR